MSKEEYKIEKNIPFPKKAYQTIYPWADMKINDSFLVPDYTYKLCSQLWNNGRAWAKRNYPDRSFSVRQDGTSLRVWRIK